MKKISTALALILCTITLPAQWDTLITNSNATFDAAGFTSSDSGLVIGYDPATNTGRVFQTTNSGATWTQNAVSGTTPALHAITFFDHQTGWMAGDSGSVYRSTDAGITWTAIPKFTSENLSSISMPTMSSVFVAGTDGGLYNSLDGGVTWDTLNSGTVLPVRDLDFVYANTGWVIGDGGYMGVTADGGVTWNYFPHPYFGFFEPRGFAYVGTTNTAYCVGESGLAITSADAGLTWSIFSVPATQHLNSVKFGNNLSGVICGDNNFIYRTSDGGMSWNVDAAPGMTCNLRKVCWASDSVAYIVGSNGRVLKNNSAISAVHEITPVAIAAIAFPNPFSSQLTLSLQLENAGDVTITVTDISGRTLSVENAGNISAGRNTVAVTSMDNLSAGMYFVEVTTGVQRVSIPVVKN